MPFEEIDCRINYGFIIEKSSDRKNSCEHTRRRISMPADGEGNMDRG